MILSEIINVIDNINKYETGNNIFKKLKIRKMKKSLKEYIDKIAIVDTNILKEYISIASDEEFIKADKSILSMGVSDNLFSFKFKKKENNYDYIVHLVLNDDLASINIKKENSVSGKDFSESINFSFSSYVLSLKEDYNNSYKVRINDWLAEYIRNYCHKLI